MSTIIKAFEANRFVLYRQQKVASMPDGSGRLHYEVLLRLQGEDGAIITPGEFLPAAERYGLAPSFKIDGDFVRGMDSNHERFAIVKAIHTLAHELGKQTIAEQVEEEAERICLKEIGIDFMQGYLLHRPAPRPNGRCEGTPS